MVPVTTDLRMATSSTAVSSSSEVNTLKHEWYLWAHLPQDCSWDLSSYKNVSKLTSVQETIAITESLPEDLIKNCMLFIMRKGITPMWEDKQNINGGCFSYKVSNKNVVDVWRDLSYVLVGNTISADIQFVNSVTGITISPKKNFCIVKIWMANCVYQSPTIVTELKNLTAYGCLFKKHVVPDK